MKILKMFAKFLRETELALYFSHFFYDYSENRVSKYFFQQIFSKKNKKNVPCCVS